LRISSVSEHQDGGVAAPRMPRTRRSGGGPSGAMANRSGTDFSPGPRPGWTISSSPGPRPCAEWIADFIRPARAQGSAWRAGLLGNLDALELRRNGGAGGRGYGARTAMTRGVVVGRGRQPRGAVTPGRVQEFGDPFPVEHPAPRLRIGGGLGFLSARFASPTARQCSLQERRSSGDLLLETRGGGLRWR